MNVATYGFTMIAARLLGPPAYGAFAGLMATLLVVTVLQLGLQATAARRISADPDHVGQIERSILGVTYRAALALFVLLLVLTPAVDAVLRLGSLPTAALVAVASVPLTVMGGQAGILQGERRWRQLSVLYVLSGVPRLVIGTALIWWHPSESAALVGITLGAFTPVVAGWWFLRSEREPGAISDRHGFRSVMVETFNNSQALLAFFALSNVDVIVARNVLSEHQAGLYAGGIILTKAVLFLPQFVVVVAFPSMSTIAAQRRALVLSLAVVTGIGFVVTLGAAILPRLALVFVGGQQYVEITNDLAGFAVLGTLLAALQLLVYSVLARQAHRSVLLVWLALVVLVGVGAVTGSFEQLLVAVIAVDGTLFLALLALGLRRAGVAREG
jgi:O-antigen/teichoic acid export membrane protein